MGYSTPRRESVFKEDAGDERTKLCRTAFATSLVDTEWPFEIPCMFIRV